MLFPPHVLFPHVLFPHILFPCHPESGLAERLPLAAKPVDLPLDDITRPIQTILPGPARGGPIRAILMA